MHYSKKVRIGLSEEAWEVDHDKNKLSYNICKNRKLRRKREGM